MHNIHPLHSDTWPVSPAAAARILAEQSRRKRMGPVLAKAREVRINLGLEPDGRLG